MINAYPSIPSTVFPDPHRVLPVPDAPTSVTIGSHEESGEEDEKKDDSAGLQSDQNFDEAHSSRPHLIAQEELHDLVQDLQLPENKTEMLASRLQQWNLLPADVSISLLMGLQSGYTKYCCLLVE